MTFLFNLDDGTCVSVARYRQSPAPRPISQEDWHDISIGWIIVKSMAWIECVTAEGRTIYIQVAHITRMQEVDE